MRRLVFVLVVVGCGPHHRIESAALAAVLDAQPPAIQASVPPTPPAGVDAGTEPTVEDLRGDPAMDGSFGGPGLPSGGGYGQCSKHPITSTMTMSAPSSSSADLDATALGEAVGPLEPALQLCFDQVACPSLHAYSMHMRFTIELDGSISAPVAETKNATIEQCMEGVITGLRLPKPSGGAPIQVTYELTFHT